MSEKDRKSSLVGSIAKKAIGAVVTPIQGAVALARAVVGGDEESRDQGGRPEEGVEIPRPSEPSAGDSDSATVEPTFESGPDEPTFESQEAESEETAEEQQEAEAPELGDIWGVGESRAEALRGIGLASVADVAAASVDELSEISGVGESTAQKMIDSAEELTE